MSWRVVATLTLIAWGALAFGAVYPWAFLPLFAGCTAVGGAELLQRNGSGKTEPVLAGALALVIAAIALQLVPLPAAAIIRVSPETDVILQRYVVGYGTLMQSHPLSIQPGATLLGLAAAGSLTVFFLGSARALTNDDTKQIARGVSFLGIILSLAGTVQKGLWNGKIYGVWTPIESGNSFGPFVNRNHFAGWILMALPIAAGYFCGRVAHGTRQVKPGWRNRLVWLSSRDASETILVGFAGLLMAVAVVLSLSRSGILGLLATLIFSGWFVARRLATASRRAIVTGYLVFVALLAGGWTGLDNLAARFAESDGGRLALWTDAWHIAKRFPIVGTGLNTYGSATLSHQTVDPNYYFAEAHNDYLQLLAEGGALVGIPAALAIIAFAWTVRRRFRDVPVQSTDYWIRIGAVTGISAMALQEIIDFSLQMPGNAALFVLLCGIAMRKVERRQAIVCISARRTTRWSRLRKTTPRVLAEALSLALDFPIMLKTVKRVLIKDSRVTVDRTPSRLVVAHGGSSVHLETSRPLSDALAGLKRCRT